MATASAGCKSCGAEPSRLGARFCDVCGTSLNGSKRQAEYKQVTVLFADVVHSMDIAAAVGTERLREIMTALLDRLSAVVQRYGGTIDKFTGDGIMAVFGAPTALEDHAFRACLAALQIQAQAADLASDVEGRDGIDLHLRIGLNSGRVVTGEIGSVTASYTAIGEQVGFAQRMESVAHPGGVMLSESTARLVENIVLLGEPEPVHIKGADGLVLARPLRGIGKQHPRQPIDSTLVGRTWELNTLTAILEEAIGGAGCVVNVTGSVGIGKSRLVREAAEFAASRGLAVLTAHCESHASDIPFHAVARLLRVAMGVDDLDAASARERVRDQFPGADGEDLLLLHDLLGIGDPAVALPDIAPDARRRRLTALVNSASLACTDPALFVIEDAHWIDEVSESMLTDFLAVVPQTPSLVVITYRPEYRGALTRVSGAQTLALRPLNDLHTSALTAELLGADPSLGELAAQVAARAAGNPFFAEEIVRDLAERGVLHGKPGAYLLIGDAGDVDVPATLQATIGARIDRLDPAAKHTLTAAAVIGSRFDTDLLAALVDDADVGPLIAAELVDPVAFAPRSEYAFHHPIIQTVAYETQLLSDRVQLHRRVATVIEARDPASADENAALIAEHLEAAGDLHGAFEWHMRAGTWSTHRNITAAQTSWRRARQVADRLPADDPARISMRIAPRTLLCGTAMRLASTRAVTGFEELRELCTAAGDEGSLAVGMAGLVLAQNLNRDPPHASRLATELVALLESIGDPTLTVALSVAAIITKHLTGETAEVLRLAQRVIDLADGDATKGNVIFSSPLTFATALRGTVRYCFGIEGWKCDLHRAAAMAGAFDATTVVGVFWYTKMIAISNGVLLPDATALRDTAENLAMAAQCGDDLALALARAGRPIILVYQDCPGRQGALKELEQARDAACKERITNWLPFLDSHIAREKARLGEVDAAVELARSTVDGVFASGGVVWSLLSTAVLVEALLQRSGDADLRDAQAAIARLAAVPTDPGFVLHELWLLRLRAMLAQARGNEGSFRNYRDRYRARATSLGFEGHMAMAEAMA
jgi:adenylate cyclase